MSFVDKDHKMPVKAKIERIEQSEFWRVLTSAIREWFGGEFRSNVSPDNWTTYSAYSFDQQAAMWAHAIGEEADCVIGAAKSGRYMHKPLAPTQRILDAVGLPLTEEIQIRRPEYQTFYCIEKRNDEDD